MTGVTADIAAAKGGASAPLDAVRQDNRIDTGSARSDYGIRVTASDDNRSLFLSFYNVPIPPEVGMKLALALLDASVRLMDRRAAALRETASASTD